MSDLQLANGARLNISSRPHVMGVLNVTPDSFWIGSRISAANAEAHIRKMVDAGVDIIDVGGESSRPGSRYVDEAEECRRVIPVIQQIRQITAIPISIDTRKYEVARRALDAGADIVNDISALQDEPRLAELVVERRVPVVLMHKRGTPLHMQQEPYYNDTVGDIRQELHQFVQQALKQGICRQQIVLDPGIGFGKRLEDNLRILARLNEFTRMGFPVLVGVSRKSFIGAVLGRAEPRPVEHRLAGTIACQTLAILRGGNIIRTHDVPEAIDLIRMLAAIREHESDAASENYDAVAR